MDYDKAALHWIEKDKNTVKMKKEDLILDIEQFLNKHNTCALATACDDFVRCTPIEYNYYNSNFYLFSEGGLKFKALKDNKHVCLAIYDEYKDFGALMGMQVTGIAEMVEPFSNEYIQICEIKKIPLEVMKKLPEPMNLIKIKPTVIDYLNAQLKKEGYGTRQQITL